MGRKGVDQGLARLHQLGELIVGLAQCGLLRLQFAQHQMLFGDILEKYRKAVLRGEGADLEPAVKRSVVFL